MSPIAMVRAVPDSFAGALVMGERPSIDVGNARAQHAAYRKMLSDAGYQVRTVAADEGCPDCPFIEDTAVVLDSFAMITRPGAEERQPEVGPVAEALGELMPVARMEAPATLDGGDVLRVGNTLFVGKSARTNPEGIAWLAEMASADGLRVVAVPLSGVLHLKTAVLGLDDETVLIAPQFTDPAAFVGYRWVEKPPGEALSSALRLHDGRVVVTANSPLTMGAVSVAGFDVEWFDAYEFQKADGGLTCLSLLFNMEGGTDE
jgi:dimethylargininase